MGELYEIRSAVEHLNEHLYITGAGRESRIEMLKNAQILEWLARHCLCRVMLNETLHEHFATDESLMAFWRRPRDEQQRLWGDAVDPRAAVQDFDANGIGDHELGL